MAFEKGHKKSGGRQKGTKNKFDWHVESLADRLGVNPLEILLRIAAGDWAGLGYEEPKIFSYTNDGRMISKDIINLDQRLRASEAAAKYLFSQKKTVELTNAEDKGFKIVVEDY